MWHVGEFLVLSGFESLIVVLSCFSVAVLYLEVVLRSSRFERLVNNYLFDNHLFHDFEKYKRQKIQEKFDAKRRFFS